MLVVGLTGGIATGKTSVSTRLSTVHNIPIIDADFLARSVVSPGSRCLSQIVSVFGPRILLADGTLDRQKLGGIVFSDVALRRKLNGIVHPAVRWEMGKQVLRCWMSGEKVCVVDVPLLIEGGLWKWVREVVVVYCSPEIQLNRLLSRDTTLTPTEAQRRISSQLPITEKVAYADHVIDNSGSRQDMEKQVDTFARSLLERGGAVWWNRLCWLIPPLGLGSGVWTLLWRACRSRLRGTWTKARQD